MKPPVQTAAGSLVLSRSCSMAGGVAPGGGG
jgi:hypothetical protein